MKLELSNLRTFQDILLPTHARLAGWAALAQALSVKAPVRRPSAISDKHVRGSRRTEGSWTLLDRRYWPGDDFEDHLSFALRHEDMDLLVLKRVFETVGPNVIARFVRRAPTGIPARRVWYLWETLMGRTLDLSDAPGVAAVDLLDTSRYFTGKPRLSRRHRVRDNLLGGAHFCPILRRTKSLKAFVERRLGDKAREIIGRTRRQLVTRQLPPT